LISLLLLTDSEKQALKKGSYATTKRINFII